MSKRRKKSEKEISEETDKAIENIKSFIIAILGIAGLVWFIVMLPTQPDFEAIIIFWVLIGIIYLFFKLSNKV